MRAWWIAVFVVLSLGIADADTGGSMGGGSWSSSSSSSRRSSSSSSHSYSSSHSSSGGGGNLPAGAWVGILAIVFVVWCVFVWAQSQGGAPDNSGGSSTYEAVDVSVLRIAIDGRARKFVQTELARIAKVANTTTSEGRLATLREVELLLRRTRDAWVYGGAINEPMRSLGVAKGVFDAHVTDARARFREEVIRNAQGTITTSTASESIPRSEEGAGLILVSIIVAARSELFTVAHIADGEDLRKALEAASHRPASDLVAIEIVWQPAEDSDRLSSMELEAKYPAPQLMPLQGALVGKTFCAYCGGPFPAELVSCPHCGAPSRGQDTAAPRAA